MGYSFMRIEKLSSEKNLSSAYAHNLREMDVKNASKELAALNEELVSLHGRTYKEAFEERIASLEYYKNHKVHTNHVRALEVLTTFSPSEKERIDLEAWKRDNVEWLRKEFNADQAKYGDNVISVVYHGDEAGNVHCHAVVIPIDDRGHLNSHHYIGGPPAMKALQDSYGEFMKERHNLERGMENSKATHEEIRQFYNAVNKALSQNAPEIEPEESLEQYKARIDQWAKEKALKELKEKKETKKEIVKVKTEVYNKYDAERKQLRSELRKSQKETEELVHNFGDMKTITAKLEAMENLQKAFATHPDEEYRERVRREMNDMILFGRKERQKEKDKKNNKER